MSCDDSEPWRSLEVHAESVFRPVDCKSILFCLAVSLLCWGHRAADEMDATETTGSFLE